MYDLLCVWDLRFLGLLGNKCLSLRLVNLLNVLACFDKLTSIDLSAGANVTKIPEYLMNKLNRLR